MRNHLLNKKKGTIIFLKVFAKSKEKDLHVLPATFLLRSAVYSHKTSGLHCVWKAAMMVMSSLAPLYSVCVLKSNCRGRSMHP